jgi:hypothetical protein
LLLLPAPGYAGPADELAALFLRTCLPFAGNPKALRLWATGMKLPEVPDPARPVFLGGAPGMVFDASTPESKLALLSSDDGICAAVTDKAEDQATAQALERTLERSNVQFRLVIERNDKFNPKLHHREYLATLGPNSWRILVATVRDTVPGNAMLTAAPE